jgi:hypothetical protein
MAQVVREDRGAMDESVRKPMTFLAVVFIGAAVALGYGRVTAGQTFLSDFGAGKELGHVEFKGEAANLVYKVEQGDTWWKIARDHEISTRALLEANGADIGTSLTPGQNIHLPGRGPAGAPSVTPPYNP